MSCFSPKDKYFLTGNEDYDNQRMGQRKCIQVRTFTQWAHPLHHKLFLQPKPTSTFSTSCLVCTVKKRLLGSLMVNFTGDSGVNYVNFCPRADKS